MNVDLHQIDLPALVVNGAGSVVEANSAAAALWNRDASVLQGRDAAVLLSEGAPDRADLAAFIPATETVRQAASGRRLARLGDRSYLVHATGTREGHRLLFLVDVTDLDRARAEAEEHAGARTGFLAKVSHEIRSAVASMVGFAEMLDERVARDHRELTEIITDSGRHLIDTLNGVMDLARVEFGDKDIERVEVDVVRRTRDRVEVLRPEAEAKGLELVVKSDGAPLLALLNPIFFDRILHNLIDNAIKYTDQGRVEVDMEQRDGRVWIYVADTGRGMNASFVPRLFAPFEREERAGDAEAAGEHEGTGLGLAMTHHLVELMDGHIFACSTADEGSTFTVSFPALQV